MTVEHLTLACDDVLPHDAMLLGRRLPGPSSRHNKAALADRSPALALADVPPTAESAVSALRDTGARAATAPRRTGSHGTRP
ncbi:ribosomal protein L7/L12 [Streptomyces sp. NPDC015171]|uniref:ribosomal protein L7/L12 n=1 Tax=Streptomyces sp. NPDC015171 TaxID=3364945 RepID=UPI0036FD89E2